MYPAEQISQLDDATIDAVPAPQLLHEDEPSNAENEPGLQAVQLEEPRADMWPTGHI
jgi:hypothetical protein